MSFCSKCSNEHLKEENFLTESLTNLEEKNIKYSTRLIILILLNIKYLKINLRGNYIQCNFEYNE